MVRAGGARRCKASHDADFILYRQDGCAQSYPQIAPTSALVATTCDRLTGGGSIAAAAAVHALFEPGFCQI